MTKKVLLSVPDQMYRKLTKQLKLFSYSTVQEIILETLREKYFRQTHTPTGNKRGRPKEQDSAMIMTRKKIFAD